MNFFECLVLLQMCVEEKILTQTSRNNIAVYREAGSYSSAGWYSENIHSVAGELYTDMTGQVILLSALHAKKEDAYTELYRRTRKWWEREDCDEN